MLNKKNSSFFSSSGLFLKTFFLLFFIIIDTFPKPPVFGISFPPVKDETQMSFTLTHLRDLGISNIRISEHWKFREPTKKTYLWQSLDKRIDFVTKNNLTLLLTIEANGPEWAVKESRGEYFSIYNNPEDFRNYVDTLTKRYKNRIQMIQFGNEWDIPNYNIDEDLYVVYNNILYDVVKKNSPQTEVVLGGMIGYYRHYHRYIKSKKEFRFPLDSSCAKDYTNEKIKKITIDNLIEKGPKSEKRTMFILKNAKYDCVDVHLYDDIEYWEESFSCIVALTKKPIIISEFSCIHPEYQKYSHQYQAERLALALKTIEQLPVREAYYFSLVDLRNTYHTNSGLFDEEVKKKPSYDVFKKFLKRNQ